MAMRNAARRIAPHLKRQQLLGSSHGQSRVSPAAAAATAPGAGATSAVGSAAAAPAPAAASPSPLLTASVSSAHMDSSVIGHLRPPAAGMALRGEPFLSVRGLASSSGASDAAAAGDGSTVQEAAGSDAAPAAAATITAAGEGGEGGGEGAVDAVGDGSLEGHATDGFEEAEEGASKILSEEEGVGLEEEAKGSGSTDTDGPKTLSPRRNSRGSSSPQQTRQLSQEQLERIKERVADLSLTALNKEMSTLIATNQFLEARAAFYAWKEAHGGSTPPPVLTYNFLLHAMMRSGEPLEALEDVLVQMEGEGTRPNTLSYNALIRSLFRAKDSQMAEAVMKKMEEVGVKPDGDSYNMVVTLAAMNRRVNAAMLYLNSMLRSGFVPTKTTYFELLVSCARTRRSRDALAVLKEIEAQSIAPLASQLGELLSMAVEAEDSECALHVLRIATARNIVMDHGILLLLLSLAARGGRVQLAELVWSCLLSKANRGISIPPPFHLARIHAYAAAGDLTSAFRSIRELDDAISGAPASADVAAAAGVGDADVAASAKAEEHTTVQEWLNPYTSLHSLTAVLSQGVGIVDNAYFTLEKMHSDGEAISLAAVNCVIAACGQLRDADRAEQTFDEIQRTFQLQPDTNSYTALIDSYGRSRRPNDAEAKFEELKSKGLTPASHSYVHMIDAFIAAFNPEKALQHTEEMTAAGHVPPRDLLMRLFRRSQRSDFPRGADVAFDLVNRIGYRQPASGEARRRLALREIAVEARQWRGGGQRQREM